MLNFFINLAQNTPVWLIADGEIQLIFENRIDRINHPINKKPLPGQHPDQEGAYSAYSVYYIASLTGTKNR